LAAGLSLAAVAGDDMSRQAVHQYETARARPTLSRLKLIAKRLGVSLAELRSDVRDPRERQMADLDETRRHEDLARLADRVLHDRTARPHSLVVASFYAGRAALYRNPDEAVALLRRARRLLPGFGEPWLAAEAMDWEAAALAMLENPLGALDLGQRALTKYRQLVDRSPRVEARMLEHIGGYLLQSGDNDSARTSYREAIEVAGSLLDLTRLAKVYHGLAVSYRRTGEIQPAIECMERAVHFYRTERDVQGVASRNLARLENDYGVLLMELARWDRAEEMIRSALAQLRGEDAERPEALLSMAELRQAQNRLGEAMELTDQALSSAQQMRAPLSTSRSYQQQGELHALQGDNERFEACFARAIEILDRAGLRERRAEAMARYRRVRDRSIEGDAKAPSSAS
jgi:tetratricopeptide (TPR) repeat protein